MTKDNFMIELKAQPNCEGYISLEVDIVACGPEDECLFNFHCNVDDY